MKRLAFLVLLALVSSLPLVMHAGTINPVVEYSSSSLLHETRPFTLGFEFSTTIAFDINALGVWNDGLGNNREVGIWDTSGNLLVSTTVLGTDPVTGHFQYAPVSFMLLPGTYVIGAEFPANSGPNPFPTQATGVTSLPGYTWITDRQIEGSGLNFPTISTGGGYGNNGILWADFSVGTTTTPEPSNLLLLGTGLVGAVGVFRRRIKL